MDARRRDRRSKRKALDREGIAAKTHKMAAPSRSQERAELAAHLTARMLNSNVNSAFISTKGKGRRTETSAAYAYHPPEGLNKDCHLKKDGIKTSRTAPPGAFCFVSREDMVPDSPSLLCLFADMLRRHWRCTMNGEACQSSLLRSGHQRQAAGNVSETALRT